MNNEVVVNGNDFVVVNEKGNMVGQVDLEDTRTPNEIAFQKRNADAYAIVKETMQKDLCYAWAWHCNIAMAVVDEGGSHELGNKAAVRFMQMAFDVDTSKHSNYQYKDITDEDAAKLMDSYQKLHAEISDVNIVDVSDVVAGIDSATAILKEPIIDEDHGDVEHHSV